MALCIYTNLASLESQRYVTVAQNAMAASLRRLSSGLRINSAADDSAGLGIASRFTGQINGLNTATRNANDGIALLQTAEGAMAFISDNLQRMRVLAVQAANGTNVESDRESINHEIQQLSSEIQRVATTTSFNGATLLDGTLNTLAFQVGANRGDVMAVPPIPGMQTSQLGSAGTAFKAELTGTATLTALQAGDLTLNGAPVAASQAGSTPGNDADSALAIARAINGVEDTSGVTATAQVNTLTGAAPINFGDVAANTFTINGVNIGAVAGGGNATAQGANLAAAITAVATQSGVSATADASGKVKLAAADGRNINIGLGGSAANAATAAANKTAFLDQTGLAAAAVGTQAADPVAARNTLRLTGSIVPADAGRAFAINGVNFTITNLTPSAVVNAGKVWLYIDTSIPGNRTASAVAAALASAIAIAKANPATAAALSTISVALSASDTISIDDLTPGLSGTSISSNVSTASVTNVFAGAAPVAGSTATNRGTIRLSSSKESGITIAGSNAANAGFTAGLTIASPVETLAGIVSVNVLTAAAAQNAIKSIDGALTSVGSARGTLGAYLNRFSSGIANMHTTMVNLSASRSRIQDTDFATETAIQTRASIMMQASLAMLAQANANPKIIKSLLLKSLV